MFAVFQVGFLLSPVMPDHSGQYLCRAEYGGRSSEYTVLLNVLPQTRWVMFHFNMFLWQIYDKSDAANFVFHDDSSYDSITNLKGLLFDVDPNQILNHLHFDF